MAFLKSCVFVKMWSFFLNRPLLGFLKRRAWFVGLCWRSNAVRTTSKICANGRRRVQKPATSYRNATQHHDRPKSNTRKREINFIDSHTACPGPTVRLRKWRWAVAPLRNWHNCWFNDSISKLFRMIVKKIRCSVGFTTYFYLHLLIPVLLYAAGLHTRGGKVGCSEWSLAHVMVARKPTYHSFLY